MKSTYLMLGGSLCLGLFFTLFAISNEKIEYLSYSLYFMSRSEDGMGSGMGIGEGCTKMIDGVIYYDDGTRETLQEWINYNEDFKHQNPDEFDYNYFVTDEVGLFC